MTVEFVTPEGEVICIWFNGSVKSRESFDQELLMKIELVANNKDQTTEEKMGEIEPNPIGTNIPTMGSHDKWE